MALKVVMLVLTLQDQKKELDEILAKRAKTGKKTEEKTIEEKTTLHSTFVMPSTLQCWWEILFLFVHHTLFVRRNKKIPVFRVTRPYLNLLVKHRIFSGDFFLNSL